MGDYIDVELLKAVIDPSNQIAWSAVDEAALEIAIAAAERWIDEMTGTHWKGSTETRVYTARYGDLLSVDDLLSVTTLKTDDDCDGVYETTWTTDDYKLMPENAPLDGRPYRWIEPTAWGDYTFPRNIEGGVQINGSFGASATAPGHIQQAALLASHRLWARHQHIFGRGNTSTQLAMSYITSDDDIVELITGQYLRYIYD